jgi:hypothetical protein
MSQRLNIPAEMNEMAYRSDLSIPKNDKIPVQVRNEGFFWTYKMTKKMAPLVAKAPAAFEGGRYAT